MNNLQKAFMEAMRNWSNSEDDWDSDDDDQWEALIKKAGMVKQFTKAGLYNEEV